MIAENTPLILPVHGELITRGSDKAKKSEQQAVALAPLTKTKLACHPRGRFADPATLEARVDRLLLHHNTLRRGLGMEEVDRKGLIAQLQEIAPEILEIRAPFGRC